jgi:heptaprenyl diphosphate synthase
VRRNGEESLKEKGGSGWSTGKITQLALLFALAIVLMLLEGMIPPIPTLPPGVKLGLSNIVVMYCLFFLGKGPAFTVLLLKSGFVFLTRGGTAFLMSFGGGIFSIFAMILLLSLKKKKVSYIIVSVCAAVMHNVGQLLIASLMLYSTAVFYYAPVLILSGIGMGVVTGILLRVMMPAMQRIKFK